MPNGKIGDHPITDILIHNMDVFSPEADALVREIRKRTSREAMEDIVNWFSPPPVPELTQILEAKLQELLDAASD